MSRNLPLSCGKLIYLFTLIFNKKFTPFITFYILRVLQLSFFRQLFFRWCSSWFTIAYQGILMEIHMYSLYARFVIKPFSKTSAWMKFMEIRWIESAFFGNGTGNCITKNQNQSCGWSWCKIVCICLRHLWINQSKVTCFCQYRIPIRTAGHCHTAYAVQRR